MRDVIIINLVNNICIDRYVVGDVFKCDIELLNITNGEGINISIVIRFVDVIPKSEDEGFLFDNTKRASHDVLVDAIKMGIVVIVKGVGYMAEVVGDHVVRRSIGDAVERCLLGRAPHEVDIVNGGIDECVISVYTSLVGKRKKFVDAIVDIREVFGFDGLAGVPLDEGEEEIEDESEGGVERVSLDAGLELGHILVVEGIILGREIEDRAIGLESIDVVRVEGEAMLKIILGMDKELGKIEGNIKSWTERVGLHGCDILLMG